MHNYPHPHAHNLPACTYSPTCMHTFSYMQSINMTLHHTTHYKHDITPYYTIPHNTNMTLHHTTQSHTKQTWHYTILYNPTKYINDTTKYYMTPHHAIKYHTSHINQTWQCILQKTSHYNASHDMPTLRAL